MKACLELAPGVIANHVLYELPNGKGKCAFCDKETDGPMSLNLPMDFHDWTEGQWLAAEHAQEEKQRLEDEKDLPICLKCGTKPAESNGFEERFCKCGMVHVV